MNMGGSLSDSTLEQGGSFKNSSVCDDDLRDDTSSLNETLISSEEDEGRDEALELARESKSETKSIQFWRLIVAFFLLVTATAVTTTTYLFLSQEQTNNFEAAYDQFSGTLDDAVFRQQNDIRTSLVSFAHSMSSSALSESATWPNFTMPDFEVHAQDFLKQARTEFLGVSNYVTHDQRTRYEAYCRANYKTWTTEGHLYKHGNLDHLSPAAYHPFITKAGSNFGTFDPEDELDDYLSSWTFSPPPVTYGATNINQRGPLFDALKDMKNETLMGPVLPFKLGDIIFSVSEHESFHSEIAGSSSDFPHIRYYHPVNRYLDDPSEIVAALETIVGFDVSMRNLLPNNVVGIVAVLENTCNQTYSYLIEGPEAYYLGEGDAHDSNYDTHERMLDLSAASSTGALQATGHCLYAMRIYPSAEFQGLYTDNTPEIFAVVVATAFFIVIVVFVVFNHSVQRRNEMMITKAAKSNALVSSLFPAHIRDQLLNTQNDKDCDRSEATSASKMKHFLASNKSESKIQVKMKPLAELFLETTLMFADIAGFTAWSSTREPTQVFDLLESIWTKLDALAKKGKVMKVETVGDCYVAVAGLPELRDDHAILMAQFARACIAGFNQTVKRLEVRLGPDTGDLQLRVGIHSGPVTAGVLRGERARFQLFGDTVNTAARLESTGIPNKVHVSQETAAYLVAGGKGHWLVEREDIVEAKGKGVLHTFWLTNAKNRDSAATSSATETSDDNRKDYLVGEWEPSNAKQQRLVDWITDALVSILKQIVARRQLRDNMMPPLKKGRASKVLASNDVGESMDLPINEVREIIHLPNVDTKLEKMQINPAAVTIRAEVVDQLRVLVESIAGLYNNNPFHNFAHASHVVMSVAKLMSRIVQTQDPEEEIYADNDPDGKKLQDHSYGITADPLTQFACAFSALIHDVHHPGVPNAQFITQDKALAAMFGSRSVAEQNSLVMSWELLMQNRFTDLRNTLFSCQDDADRFRALVVNSVMATDIADKELKVLRNARWEKAFSEEFKENERDSINRKATIVIEHLIQASDVAHTMQHWQIYRKWNERLFVEMYQAYCEGRSPINPSEGWYKGEIGFFDFYIIPLAKKLKDCGVFGVSSDEYLNYAQNNRREWETKGEMVVEELKKKYCSARLTDKKQ